MMELLEILVTTSLFNVVSWLAEMTVTDMMVVFLLSKPVFMIVALGAVFSGRKWGRTHYLHFQDCDRFLDRSFSSNSPIDSACRRDPEGRCLPVDRQTSAR